MLKGPLSWSEFFDEKLTVNVEGDHFNVYVKGSSGPLFYLIHGGGYTGLTWACFVEELCAKVDCQVWAPDLRGHGETVTEDSKDLSLDRQVSDVSDVFKVLMQMKGMEAHPSVIVVGHSMGGAIATHVARNNKISNIIALAVIDVVEGSAMAALGHMSTYIRSRPKEFPSEENAIQWCFSSGMTRNLRSARVSMPSQIVAQSRDNADNTARYHWRTNLTMTQPHWNGWFRGLSNAFLACTSAKILILANVDRLDTALMTGQMRGSFQTEVLPKVGHAIHEDSPAEVAEIFVKLINRYRVIIDKVSKQGKNEKGDARSSSAALPSK